ncbi:MAG: hypothetical protein JNM47_03910 [Hyphomonadaceae bacterium]|nr:hypothetical protein [Hyphomonadaceae bacterium]
MRLLTATLIALALALLPVSGVAMAKTMQGGAEAASCHDTAGHAPSADQPDDNDEGRACAEHCMTLVNATQAIGAVHQPAIANVIAADRTLHVIVRAPRAADPPDTPPPRA